MKCQVTKSVVNSMLNMCKHIVVNYIILKTHFRSQYGKMKFTVEHALLEILFPESFRSITFSIYISRKFSKFEEYELKIILGNPTFLFTSFHKNSKHFSKIVFGPSATITVVTKINKPICR